MSSALHFRDLECPVYGCHATVLDRNSLMSMTESTKEIWNRVDDKEALPLYNQEDEGLHMCPYLVKWNE